MVGSIRAGLVAICTLLAMTGSTVAQERGAREHPWPVITVTGTGDVFAQPDKASVTLKVEKFHAESAMAQEQTRATMAAVTESIRGLDIESLDIATSILAMTPVYEEVPWEQQRKGVVPELVGFRSGVEIEVSVRDVDRIGDVIESGVAAGATSVSMLRFDAREKRSMNRRALEQAVRDARDKAETVAAALGAELGGLVEVREIDPVTGWRGGGASIFQEPSLGELIEVHDVMMRVSVEATYRVREP